MEEKQFILEYGFNGPRLEFVTEEEAREFADKNPELEQKHGKPQLRRINPSDSGDDGVRDGRIPMDR